MHIIVAVHRHVVKYDMSLTWLDSQAYLMQFVVWSLVVEFERQRNTARLVFVKSK